MPKFCSICNRERHPGLCDMAELTDGRTVHTKRIDDMDGDVRKEIERGDVKVQRRWLPKPPPKKKREIFEDE